MPGQLAGLGAGFPDLGCQPRSGAPCRSPPRLSLQGGSSGSERRTAAAAYRCCRRSRRPARLIPPVPADDARLAVARPSAPAGLVRRRAAPPRPFLMLI